MAELDTLLRPISEASPAGADLTYDEQRQAIVRAFDTSASGEPQSGDEIDWQQILREVEAQCELTRDIWLPVYMARAGARAGNLEAVERGALYLAALCETYWETMHPQIEDGDFQERRSACESLTSIGGFIGPLRRIPLLEHPRFGRFSGADIEDFARDGDGAEGYGMFRSALDEADAEEVAATAERLGRIREALVRVDVALCEYGGGAGGVSFQPLYAVLDSVRSGLSAFTGLQPVDAASAEEQDRTGAPGGTAEAARVGLPGRIDSRADVIRALDAAIDYYRRREPASPVPVALSRAKSWVEMDFLAILEDIAPESLGDARRVLTSQRGES